MEPTPEQLKSFYRMSVRMSNLLRPINLVRMDERTKRIVTLVKKQYSSVKHFLFLSAFSAPLRFVKKINLYKEF
ncbi:DUF6888 family protein [Nostoc linckia]|uniref:DUF6888 family protein n=1 Tax=Nostoc linckia TaxID=92942 RepID=UPI000BFFCBA5|nr:hypothetical protein [Nostoc linckia]